MMHVYNVNRCDAVAAPAGLRSVSLKKDYYSVQWTLPICLFDGGGCGHRLRFQKCMQFIFVQSQASSQGLCQCELKLYVYKKFYRAVSLNRRVTQGCSISVSLR